MKNFAIYPLKSGSKGNSYIITNKKTNLLVDCGISAKGLLQSLLPLGISPKEINAAVITHEHGDHIKGIGTSARKYGFPVYATLETWRAMWRQVAPLNDELIKIISPDESFFLNDIKAVAYPTSHDAANPLGYAFFYENKKISVTTDTGYITDKIFAAASGSDIAVIEANHDENMLLMGKYPYNLKQRIKSDLGHLSNEAAGDFAAKLIKSGTKKIILGHLSEENNTPELALLAVKNSVAQAGLDPDRCAKFYIAEKNGVNAKPEELMI